MDITLKRECKHLAPNASAGVPFVVRGENPATRRIVAIFGLPDAGGAPFLVVEGRAGGHGAGVTVSSTSRRGDRDFCCGYRSCSTALTGGQAPCNPWEEEDNSCERRKGGRGALMR